MPERTQHQSNIFSAASENSGPQKMPRPYRRNRSLVQQPREEACPKPATSSNSSLSERTATRTQCYTARATRRERLMQQARKLCHFPGKSQIKPQEQQLALQLRDAKVRGVLGAFEMELEDLATKDAKTAATRKDPHATSEHAVACRMNPRTSPKSSCSPNKFTQ